MMLIHKRPWAKKHIHPLITVGFLAVSIALTALLWKIILTPMNEPAMDIVQGEFPTRQEVMATDNVEEPVAPVDEPDTAPSPYPVLLSKAQSAEILVVVNKKHRLASDYVPALVGVRGGNMRQEAASALESLLQAAESVGHAPKVISSYRSYKTQVSVYNGYVNQYGQAQADTFSARPGHSEHQTGLAVDVGNASGSCDLQICFGTTPLGAWIQTNAHLYGYIVRYPEGKDALTGYQYEPWHLRYVGTTTAENIYSSNVTMDQYFGIPAGTY